MHKSCIKTLYADFSHIVANLTVSRLFSAEEKNNMEPS